MACLFFSNPNDPAFSLRLLLFDRTARIPIHHFHHSRKTLGFARDRRQTLFAPLEPGAATTMDSKTTDTIHGISSMGEPSDAALAGLQPPVRPPRTSMPPSSVVEGGAAPHHFRSSDTPDAKAAHHGPLYPGDIYHMGHLGSPRGSPAPSPGASPRSSPRSSARGSSFPLSAGVQPSDLYIAANALEPMPPVSPRRAAPPTIHTSPDAPPSNFAPSNETMRASSPRRSASPTVFTYPAVSRSNVNYEAVGSTPIGTRCCGPCRSRTLELDASCTTLTLP